MALSVARDQRMDVPWWFLAMLGMNFLMGLANIATFALTRVWDFSPTHMFRLSDEGNVPTWWSSGQLFLAGLLVLALAIHLIQHQGRRALVMMLPAAGLMFLSVDEIVQFHEHIGNNYGPGWLRTGMWVSWCLPPFLVAAALAMKYVWPFLRGRRLAIRRLAYGAGFLLGSAVGLELLGNLARDNTLPMHLFVLAEEVGEMIGGSFLVWGGYEWLRSYGLRISFHVHPVPAMSVKKAA